MEKCIIMGIVQQKMVYDPCCHVGYLLRWLFQYQDSSALQAFGFDNSASRDELLGRNTSTTL